MIPSSELPRAFGFAFTKFIRTLEDLQDKESYVLPFFCEN
jgi:hypothetical protein